MPSSSLLLLLPLLLAPPLASAAPQSRPAYGPGPLRSAEAGGLDSIEERFGGKIFSFDEPYFSIAPTQQAGIHHLIFNGTGTGWQENFLLGVPQVPLSPAPLLVMFHGFGVSEYDCTQNTGLMKRAMQRGWYVVAPRGAHDVTFSIPYAQQNTEYVLDWLLSTFTLDDTRIYAAGFSMGGGGAVNYAARHLDPAHARFAAIINHTGTVSIAHAWANESQGVVDILEDPLMYGGPPSEFPFEYQRSSSIDLDPGTGMVDPTVDLARNLQQVPIQNWSATFDPLTYLLTQTDAFHQWMLVGGGSSERITVISNIHSWRTLHETQVLDFLEPQTLSIPTDGTHRLLADRDARYHHFTITQDAPGAFTPLRWNMDASLNRLVLDETANLARVVVDSSSLGLDTGITLKVIFGTQDGLPEELALDGYASSPTDVQRNGQSTTSWSWDARTQSVTLFETEAANYPQWAILP